jgi:endonuclease/exonuclease/phosphatase family metal-dependent hydrolase
MTISRALEMALTRNAGPRNVVTLELDRDGIVTPKVTATHDDLEEAERMAAAAMVRLQEAFPPPAKNGAEPLKVELTRNAKGETQISVKGDDAEALVRYKQLRAEFPLNDGTVSHDQPKEPK